MKLYFSPGACSLAVHIVLNELSSHFELVRVDLMTKLTQDGDDFRLINPQGRVPAITLDNGNTLTESVAVLQYLADQSREVSLAPENGTFERAKLQEMLNFLTADVHKAFGPLFMGPSDEERERIITEISAKFDYLNTLLTGKDYLVDNQYSIADIYLFVIAGWAGPMGISLADWPQLTGLIERIAERPNVIKSMTDEGLFS